MARGFLGAIVKVSKAIDAANKRATREAEKQHNQAVRMQKVAEKEYLANLKKQEQEEERRLKYNSLMKKQYQRENDRRLKEQQVLEKKLSKEEEIRRKEQFDKQLFKAKNQYAKRCETRQALREFYIQKILK